ncbi:MAG: hypothetical protein SV201_08060 [Pseudomonadota bacterium]|nr:hypothetical protein [Pseudomonadota bacterium]
MNDSTPTRVPMSSIDATMKNAVNGMQAGITTARRAASQIAAGRGDSESLQDLKQAERQVASNARSVEQANEALGGVIDVKA